MKEARAAVKRLAGLARGRRWEGMRVGKLEAVLAAHGESLLVPITTLAPEPFDLHRPIQVVVRPAGEEYVATFFDANISMSGDTEEEAISNLRELIVDVFEELEADEANLGPEPSRQLAVLRTFMERTATA